MPKIDITYITNIEIFDDEEFGAVDSQDNYFVIHGLPTKRVSIFLEKVASVPGCSRRPTKGGTDKDGRLRINWNEFYDYDEFLEAKEKIIKTIKHLVPDAKVRYRQLGRDLIPTGDYDQDDTMTLEGAFTDEERDCIPIDQRAGILGIRRQ